MLIYNMSKTKRSGEYVRGEDNHKWKGDLVGYSGIHYWVSSRLGKPKECWKCGTVDYPKYEWSNISGQYKRQLSDWERMCVPCHRKKDAVPAWNKGLKIQTNTGRTHFKPGQSGSLNTQFKKGVPSGKRYLPDVLCKTCGKIFRPFSSGYQFCSRSCYWESMKGKPVTPIRFFPKACEHCGKTYKPRTATSRYCSNRCTGYGTAAKQKTATVSVEAAA
jgi:hypothetical protein